MRTLLALACVLALSIGSASAAEQLTDPQLDTVVAGCVATGIAGGGSACCFNAACVAGQPSVGLNLFKLDPVLKIYDGQSKLQFPVFTLPSPPLASCLTGGGCTPILQH